MSREPNLFLVRAGKNGEDEETAIQEGKAILRFREVGSLEKAHSREEVAARLREALPDEKPKRRANRAGQLWIFKDAMREGDLVVLPRKLTSQIAVGRVEGPYAFVEVRNQLRHTRRVSWTRPDVPRPEFGQDLLYSFGAFMTICQISRNRAAKRVLAVLQGEPDPGSGSQSADSLTASGSSDDTPNLDYDLAQAAHDQIVSKLQDRFRGHELTNLVAAVLEADGWATHISPPGPDGGVDILAGRGPIGLDSPHLCVQVKSQKQPAGVEVYRTLQGTMHSFGANQGLLVCWGGFTQPVWREARTNHFAVRLWESKNLIQAVYRNYERLPEEIQTVLPLKRVWMLVAEQFEE